MGPKCKLLRGKTGCRVSGPRYNTKYTRSLASAPMLTISQELLLFSLSRLLNFIHEPEEKRHEKLQKLITRNSSCSIPELIESPSSQSLPGGLLATRRRVLRRSVTQAKNAPNLARARLWEVPTAVQTSHDNGPQVFSLVRFRGGQ